MQRKGTQELPLQKTKYLKHEKKITLLVAVTLILTVSLFYNFAVLTFSVYYNT